LTCGWPRAVSGTAAMPTQSKVFLAQWLSAWGKRQSGRAFRRPHPGAGVAGLPGSLKSWSSILQAPHPQYVEQRRVDRGHRCTASYIWSDTSVTEIITLVAQISAGGGQLTTRDTSSVPPRCRHGSDRGQTSAAQSATIRRILAESASLDVGVVTIPFALVQ
jgi:hypothetical protein